MYSFKSKITPGNFILEPRLVLKKINDRPDAKWIERTGILRGRLYPANPAACERERPGAFHPLKKQLQRKVYANVIQGEVWLHPNQSSKLDNIGHMVQVLGSEGYRNTGVAETFSIVTQSFWGQACDRGALSWGPREDTEIEAWIELVIPIFWRYRQGLKHSREKSMLQAVKI